MRRNSRATDVLEDVFRIRAAPSRIDPSENST
jgi:hypothetical protein